MVSLHHIRRRSSLVRGVLAIFAIAWVQLAVLPCAMAGMADAPPVMSMTVDASTTGHEGHGSHHDHHDQPMEAKPLHDCIYCPPDVNDSAEDAGEASASGCLYPHAMKPDSPSGQPQAAVVDHLLPAVALDSWASSSLLDFEGPAPSRYVLPPRPRPLNLIQGVQLK